jgi:epsin
MLMMMVGTLARTVCLGQIFVPECNLQDLVRVSAKELTSLIMDEDRLRTERADRKNWKSRVTGIEEFGPQGSGYSGSETRSPPPPKKHRERPQRSEEEDLEYRLALEASKNELEEEKKRRESRAFETADDADLAKALKLSKEEEELRRRELEESNANSLFDDTPAPVSQPQYTGYNQGYQQQGAVDWFGNPVDQTQQQQPQTTGFLNNAYTQQPFQSQPTGYQNGFQQSGFDPSQFQTAQPSYIQSQPTIQPQQTAFNMQSPYGQQPTDFGSQFTQPTQPQVSSPTAGSHNPWVSIQQQQPQLDAMKPAPTGSNNPFGSNFGRPQVQQQQSSPPTLSSIAEQRTATQFNNNSYNPISNYTPPPAASRPAPPPQKETNPLHARLNNLLATGEGMDTFGNTGESRIPVQHTAPGIFVNSAGQNLNRLHAAQTGAANNPFTTQFTGAPQNTSSYGAQQSRFMPAATGPAGINSFGGSPFGQSGNNPFGVQQHQQQSQSGGSLIDL